MGNCLSSFYVSFIVVCVLAVINSSAFYFVFGIDRRGVKAPALLEAYEYRDPIYFCPRYARNLPSFFFFLSLSLCAAPSPVRAAVYESCRQVNNVKHLCFSGVCSAVSSLVVRVAAVCITGGGRSSCFHSLMRHSSYSMSICWGDRDKENKKAALEDLGAGNKEVRFGGNPQVVLLVLLMLMLLLLLLQVAVSCEEWLCLESGFGNSAGTGGA